ncbi:sensor histidine kinase [Sphingobacterium pedocola]|uniref:histidine kinase n=1 Tax=Sphingobacterium pedocola TaxID=2082722 RepID=A0ABR9TBS0_9SPHI|nr:ATP-binding protein [Sphingobacterium pedocola]MBE8722092.1 hypothetical protein [Sphingobacterium pedocola]
MQTNQSWVISFFLFFLLKAVAAYLYIRHRGKQAKETIRSLNDAADIQIALMEEARDQARRDEQQRIAQRLHDELAGTLASIKNRMEIINEELSDDSKTDDLAYLNSLVHHAYKQVRHRSHRLYEHALQVDEHRFAGYIDDMAKSAFPSKQYCYSIYLDPDSLSETSFELRSEIIQIIREAFTNILKHANANEVNLLLYRENSHIVLYVQDNGTTFKAKTRQRKELGITNIENRIRSLGGSLLIALTEEGTRLTIHFPL